MDVSSKSHHHSHSRSSAFLCHLSQLHPRISLRKCSCVLLVFLFLAILITGSAALFVIFVVKPHQPVFRLESFRLDSYKLDAHHDSSLLVSSLVSFVVNAQNPNKFGISAKPSEFRIFNQEVPIGAIHVPRFYQPPKSSNVRVRTRVFFESVNVSRILATASLKETTRNDVEVKILGKVGAKISLYHMTLLKFKVGLDCDIKFDYRQLILQQDEHQTLRLVRNRVASFPTKSQSFSKKCNLAFYLWRHKFT